MGDQAYCGFGIGYDMPSYEYNFYMYDLSDNVWVTKTFPTYKHKDGGGGSAYIDLYMFNGPDGRKVEKYVIADNLWTTLTDQPTAEGGRTRPSPIAGNIYAETSVKYDFAGDAWHGYMRGKYGHGAEVFAISGYLYGVIDSCEGANAGKSEKYDPSGDSWTDKATAPIPTDAGCGASDGTYGFIFGGGDWGYSYGTTKNKRYDPSGNVWAQRASIPQLTEYNASFYIGGMCHTIGGWCYVWRSNVNDNYRYDNGADSWITKTVYPIPGGYAIGVYVPENFPPNAPTGLSVSAT